MPGAQIVIISKDKDAAVNFHKYVYQILTSVRKNNPDAPKLLKTNERETTNSLGNRIVSLAASKESGRSFSATHLFFDELAFIQYAEEIWQAATATLAQTGGRVTAISTPKGRANLFHRIFEAPDHMGFTVFNYGWWDVPTYNPYYSELVAAVGAIERKRIIDKARTGAWYKNNRPKYTDLAWRQEFEGAFDANMGSAFSTRQLEKAFVRNYLTEKQDPRDLITEWFTSEREENKLYATGIDLARKNDANVIITYDYTSLPARMVDFKYIEAGNCEWDQLEKILLEHLQHWQPDALHDGTGVGDAMTGVLYGFSEPFMFSKTSKQNIVELLQHAMDSGAIRIPKIPVLFREHQRYTWDDKDITQDTVMANALAVSIFHDTEGVFVGVDKEISFVESY